MDRLREHAGIIGWLIVVGAVTWALGWQHFLNERINEEAERRADVIEQQSQQRAFLLCMNQNEMREVVGLAFDVLAEPREVDTEAAHRERLRLRERVQDVLEPRECPPDPMEERHDRRRD